MSETFRTTRAADGNFTILKNGFLQDTLLTSKARGIGSYVLSFPPERHWTVEVLSDQLLEGPDAVKKALQELESRGYMHRSRTRKPDGTWQWDWLMADDIRFEPSVENPLMDSPAETQETPAHTIGGLSTSGKPTDKIFKESKPKIKTLKIKTPVRTNGSVGTRKDRDGGEEIFTQQADDEHSATVNVTKVQNLKSAPTGGGDSVEGHLRLRLVGAGVEDLKPKFPKPRTSLMQDTKQYRLTVDAFQIFDWQISPLNVRYALYSLEDGCGYFNTDGERVNCYGVLMPDPDYRPSQDEIREHAECYMGQGASERFAWDQARRDFMSPAQREAVDFLNSIELELSDDEKREFYPQVTELFKRPWGSGDLAQKLCAGLQGFGSPVSGFRKRLKGLAGGSGGLAAA